MKPAIYLIQSLTMAGLQTPPDDVVQIGEKVAPGPWSVETHQRLRNDRAFTLARHRSHSSHSSHASHRSSSGGGYRSAPRTYTPAPTYRSSPDSGAGSPSRNYRSTPPVSVLPRSPSTAPRLDDGETIEKEALRGGTAAFKMLAMKVQLALFGHGYYHGAIDGLIGPQSRAAITAFQRVQGLPITGKIDDELLDALNIQR